MSNFLRSLNTFSGGAAHGFQAGNEMVNRNKLVGMQTDLYDRQKNAYEELAALVKQVREKNAPPPTTGFGMNDRGAGIDPFQRSLPTSGYGTSGLGMNDRGAGEADTSAPATSRRITATPFLGDAFDQGAFNPES
jgi:hypothetical protein